LPSSVSVTAEAVFAGLLAAAAVFLILNEGVHNWQSLWTAAAFTLFGTALRLPRSVAVFGALPQPAPQAGVPGGVIAATSKLECDK